jgi:hypothetical protein
MQRDNAISLHITQVRFLEVDFYGAGRDTNKGTYIMIEIVTPQAHARQHKTDADVVAGCNDRYWCSVFGDSSRALAISTLH